MAICRTFSLLKILIFDGENQKKCIKSLMHFFIAIFHGCLLIRFSDFKKKSYKNMNFSTKNAATVISNIFICR